jgi:hypothetical protein
LQNHNPNFAKKSSGFRARRVAPAEAGRVSYAAVRQINNPIFVFCLALRAIRVYRVSHQLIHITKGVGHMSNGIRVGVRIVHNRMLGGWYIVRGPHQSPISGRFDSREAAKESLQQAKARRDAR